MAPEILNEENYDISIDVYSLAITIWEVLHRRIPFDHVTVKRHRLSDKIIDGERPELNNDLSEEVSNLLTSCWRADASKRPTIDEVLEFCKNTTFLLPISLVEQPNENFETPPSIERSPKKHTILLVGGDDGENNDSLLMLEHSGQNWKELNTKLPYAIRGHGAQFLNNNLYIFGGQNASGYAINCTYKLSRKLQWTKMTDMNKKCSNISSSSVILNNQIWVCGGKDEQYDALKTVEMYDPEINQWKYMKEMNESRINPAAAIVNGKIFCSNDYSVECYDPSSDVWTLISNMPQKIRGHGAVETNGHFMIMGGLIREKDHSSSVWVLDTTDEDAKWIAKPSMLIPCSDFSIAKICDEVFVCGGQTEEETLDLVKVFDGEIWRDGPNMPTCRSDSPAVVITMEFARNLEKLIEKSPEKKTILLVGGDDGKKKNSLLMLDNNGESWKQLSTKLPYAIERHGAQFLDNNLYIFGGRDASGNSINFTYKLSKSLQWERMAAMKQRREYISNSSVILNNQIWACGGSNEIEMLKSVEMYDPETNQWKFMTEMNQWRSNAAAAVVNGKIFCSGGMILHSVEYYDPSSNVWTLICNMPQKIWEHGAVEMDGHLIIMGGAGERKSVWALDTTDEDGKWVEKPSMSVPRAWFSIAKIDEKIFVCGGHSNKKLIDSVDIFDGEVWRSGPEMPTNRWLASAVVIPIKFARSLK